MPSHLKRVRSAGDYVVNAPVALGKVGQIARTVKDIQRAEQWYGK